MLEMTLVEFATLILGKPLSEWQTKVLTDIESKRRNKDA